MRRLLVFGMIALASSAAFAADSAELQRGRTAIDKYGCAVCHRIPGVATPGGGIGPSLEGIAKRAYLAGTLPNRRDNMTQWIRHPQELRPGTVMPDLGVDADDASAIAAYLYAQR